MPVGKWGVKESQCQWQDVGKGSSSPFSQAREVCCLSPASSPPALSTEDACKPRQTSHGGLGGPPSTACVVPLLAHSPGSPLAPFSPSRPSLPGTPGMPGRPGAP